MTNIRGNPAIAKNVSLFLALSLSLTLSLSPLFVVYFDQGFSAAHSNCSLKYAFSIELCKIAEKKKKKHEI